jgi:single-stranded-DNA-specific exonuclease
MTKRWLPKILPEKNLVEQLSKLINLNKVLTGILIQRGVASFEIAKKFFRPQLADLHDPFLMKGMDAAILRIEAAIQNNQRILIYGDYDVDGTTAVSTVYSFFSKKSLLQSK